MNTYIMLWRRSPCFFQRHHSRRVLLPLSLQGGRQRTTRPSSQSCPTTTLYDERTRRSLYTCATGRRDTKSVVTPRFLARNYYLQTRLISSLHGIDLTCSSPDAVTLYDTAVSQYLALSGDPAGNLEAAIKHDPGFVLAHSFLAILYLLSGNVSGNHPVVRKLRRRAQILVSKGHCNHRERIHVAALTALGEGRWREATAIWEAWLLEQPVDALTIRHLHDTYFFLGDKRNLKNSVGRVLGAWDAEHPEYLKICGMFALGAEECNNYQLAEDQGMRALSQDTRDPWACELQAISLPCFSKRNEILKMTSLFSCLLFFISLCSACRCTCIRNAW